MSQQDASKYRKLLELLESNIRRGIYADGSQLPPETALAEAAGVSRSTVREALEELAKQGVVVKQQGRRSVVNAAALRGQARPLRFAWLGRSQVGEVAVYLGIYTELQRLMLGINASLLFLPMLNVADEAWVGDLLPGFDGVFLAGVRPEGITPRLTGLLEASPHTIEIDDIGPTPASCTVCTDNYRAGRMAAEWLLDRCRVPVALLPGSAQYYRAFMDRSRGLIDGFVEAGKPLHLWNFNSELELPRLLAAHPDVDLIWHPCDRSACHYRRMIERMKAGVIRSAGVDGVESELAEEPRHLSLRQPVEEIARRGFRIMLDLLSGRRPEHSLQRISPLLLPWRE